MDGTATVGVSGQTVTVTRTGGTTLLATETGSVVLGNITNPPGSGSTGTYTIRTTSAGDVTIDEDTVSVQLEKGVNRILLKVLNEGSAWEACLRVCDTQGVPLDLERL